MRTFKLFRLGRPDSGRADAPPPRDAAPFSADCGTGRNTDCNTGARIAEARPACAPEAGRHDATDDGDAVFGLIGAAIATEALCVRQDDTSAGVPTPGGPAQARDLLHALYEQYCRVLDDPRASLASDDAARIAIERTREAQPPSDLHRPVEGADSIDALLTQARVLDDVFGPLGPGETPDPADAEPVPEVLRLFAPAEYHVASARRPAGLPPALARREHQTLAIDSPLPAPVATPEHDAR
ncbi:TagK domain-containing protein [Burkholderia sp. MSMB1589WGS]|uniref:TagK domain-containing protein n=1 Tax=Burkholderia sp. MSMB1589WGS TaxID=1636425 RepID=UPI0007B87639|nr:TagK domain-containing protein [Burkholderia sp. MSMB1589WGS]